MRYKDVHEVTRLLTSSDTDVNVRHADEYRMTALMWAACYTRTPDITNVLLQHGADPSLTDDYNRTAVLMSCYNSDANLAVLQTLLSVPGVCDLLEVKDNGGHTAVMMAVACNSPRCLQMLVDKGAVCGGTFGNGKTVEEVARWNGYTEVIKVLEGNTRKAGKYICS